MWYNRGNIWFWQFSKLLKIGGGAHYYWKNANGGYNINNENNWAISNYKEYTVAKRPTIQFWGGNIYTNLNVLTSNSVKFHVAGVNNYSVDLENYSTAHVFGSFADQGIISTGTIYGRANGKSIYGLSSGASTGYQLGNSERKSFTSLCNRVPLTFANTPNCDLMVGQLDKITQADLASNKNALIDKYIYNVNTIDITNISSFSNNTSDSVHQKNNVYYYHNKNQTLTLQNSTDIIIPSGTTQVVHGKNLNIKTNLIYDTANQYTTLSTLPKLILYAEQNIDIDCSVSQVDAIIVAKKVTTCADGSTNQIISEQINSNQLFINGTIITSNLIANRTYGATVGKYSSLAAEIINFDPSLYYLNVSPTTDINTSNINSSLTTTYQKELAPRY